MEKLVIEGGAKLKGDVYISGAKNAALPIMAATLLTDEECVINNFPMMRDTVTMAKLLESLGKKIKYGKNKITVTSNGKPSHVASYELVSTMRGSFCVLGPLLAKLKKATVSLPGGCVIGVRPVDLHIKGIKALGAKVEIENGYVIATANKLKATHMYLGGVFGSSVLATANIMMAAVFADGETIIEPAACEPEVTDLANFLNKMGAKIKGQGSPRVSITGVKKLKGVTYSIIPDRIEAGTYILAAAITKGTITLHNANLEHLMVLVDKLKEVGVNLESKNNKIKVSPAKEIKPVSITTYPYPGFPTDLQAQFMALMALAEGVSIITDKVYPDRFIHIAELDRMGANIRREGSIAIIEGVKELRGAAVMASDLRASAALIVAGLAARGKTEVHRIYHLERGYVDFDGKLRSLGAKISRVQEK